MQRTTIRMAPWVLGAISLAALSLVAMSSYFYFYGDSYLLRYAGMALAALALAAAADAAVSRSSLPADGRSRRSASRGSSAATRTPHRRSSTNIGRSGCRWCSC